MTNFSFAEAIIKILQKDTRYLPDAYFFVKEALDFTTEHLKVPPATKDRHITGKELLTGIKKYAIQEFGAMAKKVLNCWGVRSCPDFGNIVYNMIEAGILGKSEEDSIHDFDNGYDFDTAFLLPFKSFKERRAILKAKTKNAE
jgi:uncharacterized repeat protein (TIGR04138 family)